MSNWTLESELCKFTGESTLVKALTKLGILKSSDFLIECRIVQDWKRGGAESFNFLFDVISKSEETMQLILKAYTPSLGIVNIEDALKNIMRKRKLIEDYSNKTPKLFFYGNGVWLEERIPYQLNNRIHSLADDRNKFQNILNQLFLYSATLDKLGFNAQSPFSDLLTNDISIFIVDFGEDLGEPNASSGNSFNQEKLFDWLNNLKLNIPPSLLNEAKEYSLKKVFD